VDTVDRLGNSKGGIAAACTLRNWLGMWSVQTAPTRADVDVDADH
jgi:hypothetical protein